MTSTYTNIPVKVLEALKGKKETILYQLLRDENKLGLVIRFEIEFILDVLDFKSKRDLKMFLSKVKTHFNETKEIDITFLEIQYDNSIVSIAIDLKPNI